MRSRFAPIVIVVMLAAALACGGYGDGESYGPTSPQDSDSTAASSPPGDDPGSPY